jgi:hypothetical protein
VRMESLPMRRHKDWADTGGNKRHGPTTAPPESRAA